MTKIPKNLWDDMKCGEESRSNPMDEYLNYPLAQFGILTFQNIVL